MRVILNLIGGAAVSAHGVMEIEAERWPRVGRVTKLRGLALVENHEIQTRIVKTLCLKWAASEQVRIAGPFLIRQLDRRGSELVDEAVSEMEHAGVCSELDADKIREGLYR
jgi:hypothetical protein